MPPIQPINTATTSIHKKAHAAWVKYFNSHKFFLTLGNSAVDYQGPYTPRCCYGVGLLQNRATKEQVEKELTPVCRMFQKGSYEQCRKRLAMYSKIEPDIDVLGAFSDLLQTVTGSKKIKIQEIIQKLQQK